MPAKFTEHSSPLTMTGLPRREALRLGATLAGGLLLSPFAAARSSLSSSATASGKSANNEQLPLKSIEEIVGAEGTVTNGVLDIPISRDDIGNVSGPHGVTFTGDFEIHGDLYFQPLEDERALLNGDMALLPHEVNHFIAKLIDEGLVFQAYHQLWFVHFRGVGSPTLLATKARAALSVTGTSLPQSQPQNPTTPLDPDKLASILHGEAQVGGGGVVSVSVNRRHAVKLGSVVAQPDTGISTTVEFKPLGGSSAAVVPDFSLTADEVNPVVELMLNDLHWFQGCLYNQETDEHPQLYFDHMLKVGDAYSLAHEIRSGLDKTWSD
jgi:hypothetical protein